MNDDEIRNALRELVAACEGVSPYPEGRRPEFEEEVIAVSYRAAIDRAKRALGQPERR